MKALQVGITCLGNFLLVSCSGVQVTTQGEVIATNAMVL